MIAIVHVVCSYPGCGHTATMKSAFDWPLDPIPEAEIPPGWSVVMRNDGGEKPVTMTVYGDHDFQFADLKSRELRPIGFEIKAADEAAS